MLSSAWSWHSLTAQVRQPRTGIRRNRSVSWFLSRWQPDRYRRPHLGREVGESCWGSSSWWRTRRVLAACRCRSGRKASPDSFTLLMAGCVHAYQSAYTETYRTIRSRFRADRAGWVTGAVGCIPPFRADVKAWSLIRRRRDIHLLLRPHRSASSVWRTIQSNDRWAQDRTCALSRLRADDVGLGRWTISMAFDTTPAALPQAQSAQSARSVRAWRRACGLCRSCRRCRSRG